MSSAAPSVQQFDLAQTPVAGRRESVGVVPTRVIYNEDGTGSREAIRRGGSPVKSLLDLSFLDLREYSGEVVLPSLRSETGRFIHNFGDWKWWATLTFRDYVSRGSAMRVFRSWLRTLAKLVYRHHLRVAWGFELQDREVWHIHLLLETPGPTSPELEGPHLQSVWRAISGICGISKIEPFDTTRGAGWYLSKGTDWDVNVACPRTPRCRRSGCREAPGSW